MNEQKGRHGPDRGISSIGPGRNVDCKGAPDGWRTKWRKRLDLKRFCEDAQRDIVLVREWIRTCEPNNKLYESWEFSLFSGGHCRDH
jgi:hypothetical protein